MRTWGLVLGLMLVGGSLASCATEDDPPGRTLTQFCAAVERAPKDDTSLAQTRAAVPAVVHYAPNEIRAEVITILDALDEVYTATELETLAQQKGPLRASLRKYHDYVEVHCYSG